MKRRDFFRSGALTAVGTGLLVNPFQVFGRSAQEQLLYGKNKEAKNIIFLVSDGMSTGTLNMTDMFKYRKYGKPSHWMQLYRENKISRGLMETASANSLVTDSAAASSSWGGGVRVNNGSLNVGPKGEEHKPILQKFKSAGKSVGCVTTVPITHATPAGFCVNMPSRGDQQAIAEKYLELNFDVMMGGGLEYFSAGSRADKVDLLGKFTAKGYSVAKTRQELVKAKKGTPLLGVFSEGGVPYTLDRENDKELKEKVPTLAEMTKTAIERMKDNPKGFALQVEGGKVDWSAHANDFAAIIYDQADFDEAVGEAISFAEKDGNTLVIITTDHGNANPGLFSGKDVNKKFDNVQNFKNTNEWVLGNISKNDNATKVIEMIEAAQNIVITKEEANELLVYYQETDESGLYNTGKLPFQKLASIQTNYTSVGWAGTGHSADFVELAMFGPGSELMKPWMKNTDLHNLMLDAASVAEKHRN